MVRGTIRSKRAGRQFHFFANLFDGFFDGGAQVAASYVEGDGDVAGVAFTKNVIGAVLDFDCG